MQESKRKSRKNNASALQDTTNPAIFSAPPAWIFLYFFPGLILSTISPASAKHRLCG
jgi:hypothetical protein